MYYNEILLKTEEDKNNDFSSFKVYLGSDGAYYILQCTLAKIVGVTTTAIKYTRDKLGIEVGTGTAVTYYNSTDSEDISYVKKLVPNAVMYPLAEGLRLIEYYDDLNQAVAPIRMLLNLPKTNE